VEEKVYRLDNEPDGTGFVIRFTEGLSPSP